MAVPTPTAPATAHGTAALRVGAALFNGDHGRLAEEVARLDAADVDFLHLDVFDGHLVPDLGFPPRTLAALRPLTRRPFEVHLAAVDPLRFLPALAGAGADLVLFHAEATPMLYEAIFAAREHDVGVGLALGLGAPLACLEPVVTLVDAVLLLARVTGEGARGAAFNPLVLPRLRAVRAMADAAGTTVDLQVAGGLRREHIPDVVAAGATALALGGGLYGVDDMAGEVAALRSLARRGG